MGSSHHEDRSEIIWSSLKKKKSVQLAACLESQGGKYKKFQLHPSDADISKLNFYCKANYNENQKNKNTKHVMSSLLQDLPSMTKFVAFVINVYILVLASMLQCADLKISHLEVRRIWLCYSC